MSQPWQHPPRPCSVCGKYKRAKAFTRLQWETSLICKLCQRDIKYEKSRQVEPRKPQPPREMLPALDARDLPALSRLAAAVLADNIGILDGTIPTRGRPEVDPSWERSWWDTEGPQVWLEACGLATSLEAARERVRRI